MNNTIPIKTVVIPSKIQDNFYSAKAVTSFVAPDGSKRIIGGYSYGQNKSHTEFIAKSELLERFYAQSMLHEKDTWSAYNLMDPNVVKKIPKHQVLIGYFPTIPSKICTDASGLGLHEDLQEAIKHAVYELIERHLLCEVWYNRSKTISPISTTKFKMEDLELNTYQVHDLPMAISFAISKKYQVVFAGSSFSDSIELSIEKANNEAMMILESNYAKSDLYCFSPLTQSRLRNIRNSDYFDFTDRYIKTLISKSNTHEQSDVTSQYVNELCSKIYIIRIVKNDSVYLVKAISDDLYSLKGIRGERAEVPYDPFF